MVAQANRGAGQPFYAEDRHDIDCLYMEPLYGVLDMLVLRTLLFGPLHGYAIAGAIRDGSRDAVKIEFGSLYPALKRLELKGWIVANWELSEHNRRAKVYRLTPVGRKQLRQETSEWAEFVAGVARLMKSASGEVKG
jgi:PadR family transcriptional regulator PadR